MLTGTAAFPFINLNAGYGDLNFQYDFSPADSVHPSWRCSARFLNAALTRYTIRHNRGIQLVY
jgi:hypothetical protein